MTFSSTTYPDGYVYYTSMSIYNPETISWDHIEIKGPPNSPEIQKEAEKVKTEMKTNEKSFKVFKDLNEFIETHGKKKDGPSA